MLPETLPALVNYTAQRFANSTAIEDGDFVISYSQLNALRIRAAKACLAAGIEKGDRCVIWAPNIAQWIIAAMGIESVGGVMVPLSPRFQGNEAGDIMARSGAKLLFTVTELEKGEPLTMLAAQDLPALEKSILLQGSDDRALSWEAFLALGDAISDQALAEREATIGGDDVMDMLFTSGTTGKPKGVLCTHSQNIRVFATWADTVGLRAEDNYLIINPFFHTFGYKAGWLACVITGCKILPMRSFDKEAVMSKIEQDKVTVMPGAPALYEMILADPNREKYDLSSLRLGVTGAAPVSVQLVEDMWNVLGFETVVTAYGMTESTGVISICRPDDPAEVISRTSGKAIDGVEMKCANPDTGEEVPRGSEGEIWVRGYNVMKGYFEMPEATAETIVEGGWMRTGDIGVMDEAGYIRITDRLKDMYIMNGENVYPAEVEGALRRLDGVAQAAVIGVPKQPQGEVGMAFIVAKPGASLTEEAVKAHCKASLASFKLPYYVRFVNELPLNASGKVVKPELKAIAKELLG
jgi:acyl-CoA synthetase (AMP-forming)/AMP-acid ligase II